MTLHLTATTTEEKILLEYVAKQQISARVYLADIFGISKRYRKQSACCKFSS